MSNTAPSRADPVVVFPLSRWCPPQETSQPHPPQNFGENPSSGYKDMGTASLEAAQTMTTISLKLAGLRGKKDFWGFLLGLTKSNIPACTVSWSPMLTFWQLGPKEQNSAKFESKHNAFYWQWCIWKGLWTAKVWIWITALSDLDPRSF